MTLDLKGAKLSKGISLMSQYKERIVKFRVRVDGTYLDVTVRATNGAQAWRKLERPLEAWQAKEGFEFEEVKEPWGESFAQGARSYDSETDWVY